MILRWGMKSEWAISGTARWISLFRRKPIELFVRLSPSDEVMQLRADVAHLEERLDQLRKEYNRTEFLYRCEVMINSQLVDLCREHGIRFHPAMFQRPSCGVE